MIGMLNYMHKNGFISLLTFIIKVAYFLKGYGVVKCKYHNEFNAYEIGISNNVFLSPGPGWVYSITFLTDILNSGFCFHYKPKEGDCIIDLGAGLGEETLIFARLVGPYGKVISVEANPRIYKALDFVTISNNYICINTLNVALFENDGYVDIDDDFDNYLTNTVNKGTSVSSYKVRAVTLDTLVEESHVDRIDFIKVNIEGAEQFLLTGSSKSLKLVQHACISCHDFRHINNGESDFYMTKERIKSFLIANSFEVIERKTGNAVVDDYLYAKRLVCI